MSNIAIILAGGVGSRVGADIPKQFIEVFGRPILSYTLERFDKHPEIDAIEVVCRKGYEEHLRQIAERDGITKIRWVAEGGATFQESVISGINHLKGEISDDDQVLIHYGASPFVGDDVISDAIRVCAEKGNASPAHSLVYLAADRTTDEMSDTFIDRDQVMCLNSPQALRYDYARWIYDQAAEKNLLEVVEPHTTSLMFALGEKIYFSKNSTSNIKITTKEDLALFEGWILRQMNAEGKLTVEEQPAL